jgi:small subunit ribosomal protein S16
MLRIRLQRLGKKKQPSYRFVISERTKDTQGRALEIVGHYNPIAQPKIIEMKVDRIKYWLSMGAQPSNTVNNILVKEGVIEGKKAKSVTITKKRQGKLDEKQKEAEEKKKAKAEAKKEAEVAAKAEAEAKKEADAAAKVAEAEAKKAEVKEEVKEEKVEEKKEEVTKEVPKVEEKVEEKKEEIKTEEKKEEAAK